jgi:hypothetical protein
MEATDTKDNERKKKNDQKEPENMLREFFHAIWHDIREKVRTAKFWLEVLAVSGGLFYAAVTFQMWRDSHKNFVVDQRAWLLVASNLPVLADIKEGMPLQSRILITNTGKTPGKKITFEFTVVMPRNTEAVEFNYHAPLSAALVGIMPPNYTQLFLVFKHAEETNPVVLTRDGAQDLLAGRSYLAVYGRGIYTDIFGEVHWFHACFWQDYDGRTGTYNASGCTRYNDTGDGYGDMPQSSQ